MLRPDDLKAIYGTFDLDMKPMDTVDITDSIRKYASDGIVHIPKNERFLKPARSFDIHKKKFISISHNDKTAFILQDDYADDIIIDFNTTAPKIIIVYFFYVSNRSNWRAILSGQLYQLKGTGILPEAEFYIHVTDTLGYFAEIKAIISQITPNAHIQVSDKNEFEYPPLKLVHDLAIKNADATFLYFHSKGMTHKLHSRSLEDITLFTETFERWRRNLQLLQQSKASKMGLFPSRTGWIWYNFWYAKGAYLASLEAPEKSENRYVYESWLGGKYLDLSGWQTCFGLYKINYFDKGYFSPKAADYHKAGLAYKIFATHESKRIRLFLRSPFLINLYVRFKSLFNKDLR